MVSREGVNLGFFLCDFMYILFSSFLASLASSVEKGRIDARVVKIVFLGFIVKRGLRYDSRIELVPATILENDCSKNVIIKIQNCRTKNV